MAIDYRPVHNYFLTFLNLKNLPNFGKFSRAPKSTVFRRRTLKDTDSDKEGYRKKEFARRTCPMLPIILAISKSCCIRNNLAFFCIKNQFITNLEPGYLIIYNGFFCSIVSCSYRKQ